MEKNIFGDDRVFEELNEEERLKVMEIVNCFDGELSTTKITVIKNESTKIH